MTDNYDITTEAQLAEILGEPNELVQQKVVRALDDAMQEFIQRSPLAFLATTDSNGLLDVSPKGDAAGFVKYDPEIGLLIPDRPGNKLLFGFRNILQNNKLGLIFVVPTMRETLRVKGTARLSNDPELLQKLSAGGKPATLCTIVTVEECFFHCGKAMIRSHLWQADKWQKYKDSLLVRQVANVLDADQELTKIIEDGLEQSYIDELY